MSWSLPGRLHAETSLPMTVQGVPPPQFFRMCQSQALRGGSTCRTGESLHSRFDDVFICDILAGSNKTHVGCFQVFAVTARGR